MSGLDVLKEVRGALQSPVPVLFVSARTNEADIVMALNQGADDYMVKPLRRPELLARLEAIGRFHEKSKPTQPEELSLGALRIDCQTHLAWRDGRSVHLTAKDFDLSVLFLRNVGQLLYREELLEAWCPGAAVSSRTLDTHISRIRHKLGLTPSNGWRLAAVYGHGYRLEKAVTSPRHIEGHAAAMLGSPQPQSPYDRTRANSPTHLDTL
jgi:two-component system response regulator RegX3